MERQCDIEKIHSTELTTAYLMGEIQKAADKGLITGALFVCVSKTFDTLGHRLITKV